MLGVVAPVLHFKVPLQPVAINVALSLPQIVNLFAVMLGVVGVTPVLITIGLDAELMPHKLLHVAVYVPPELTSILVVVAPVLQLKLPIHPIASNFTFSPSQQIVLLLLIIGADGLFPF